MDLGYSYSTIRRCNRTVFIILNYLVLFLPHEVSDFVYHNKSPKRLCLNAEIIYKSGQVERYKVSGQNRSIILQNDYPLIESRPSRKGRVNWKLILGAMNDGELLLSIIRELEYKRKIIIQTIPYVIP